jgi:hypothetical protein
MNYAFMHAGRWNELPRTERQQASSAQQATSVQTPVVNQLQTAQNVLKQGTKRKREDTVEAPSKKRLLPEVDSWGRMDLSLKDLPKYKSFVKGDSMFILTKDQIRDLKIRENKAIVAQNKKEFAQDRLLQGNNARQGYGPAVYYDPNLKPRNPEIVNIEEVRGLHQMATDTKEGKIKFYQSTIRGRPGMAKKDPVTGQEYIKMGVGRDPDMHTFRMNSDGTYEPTGLGIEKLKVKQAKFIRESKLAAVLNRDAMRAKSNQATAINKLKQNVPDIYEGLGDFFPSIEPLALSEFFPPTPESQPKEEPVDEEKLQEHEERQRNARMNNAGLLELKGKQLSFSESKEPESETKESESKTNEPSAAVQRRLNFRSAIKQENQLNDWYSNFDTQGTLPSAIPETPPNTGVTMTQAAGRTPKQPPTKSIEMQTPNQLKGYPTGDLMGTPLTQESSAQQYQRTFYQEQNEFKANVQALGKDIKAHVNKVNQVADTLKRSSAGTFYSTKPQGRLQDEFVMPPPSQSITVKQRGRYAAYPQSIRSLLSQEFPNYQFQVRLNDDHIRELRGVSGKRATLRSIVLRSGQFVQQPPSQLISNSAPSEPASVQLQPLQRFNPPVQEPVDTTGSLNIGEEGQEGNEFIESLEL